VPSLIALFIFIHAIEGHHRIIRSGVIHDLPPGLKGTAQALYGTVGIGGATACLTLVSGALYARVGAHGFWVMAALCVLAVPLTWQLRHPAGRASRAP